MPFNVPTVELAAFVVTAVLTQLARVGVLVVALLWPSRRWAPASGNGGEDRGALRRSLGPLPAVG